MNITNVRQVTERDIRRPELIDADVDDLEFREDGRIVRKDRWESAIRRIRWAIGDHRREFEIGEVADAVDWLVTLISEQPDQPIEEVTP